MRTFTKLIMLLIMTALPVMAAGQELVHSVRGKVTDSATGRPVESVAVSIPGRHYATVTNADGEYVIKSDSPIKELQFSFLGYKMERRRVQPGEETLNVRISSQALPLNESFAITGNPWHILREALYNVKDNYPQEPELLECFYRETVRKRNRYTYVSEAVARLYKTGYNRSVYADRAALEKSRVLLSQRRSDTLSIKMMGGPTEPLLLDVVKNPEVLLDENIDRYYVASLGSTAYIDDRPQFVVELRPAEKTDFALYYGTLYIDMQTMAFTRAELSLDMSDKAAATRIILVKKPLGLRFTPKKVALTINYGNSGGRYRMSYFRSEIQFNCDWKKRLIATSYSVVNELVITDLRADVQPISRADMFKSSDILSEKSAEFSDPDFWDAYNIIEPSESLEHAIGKLKKH